MDAVTPVRTRLAHTDVCVLVGWFSEPTEGPVSHSEGNTRSDNKHWFTICVSVPLNGKIIHHNLP